MGSIQRNSLCPCGSGLKYKKCCYGSSAMVLPATPVPEVPVDPKMADWAKQSRGRDQDQQMDRFLVQGYNAFDQKELPEALELWARAWDNMILSLSPKMTRCQDVAPVYDGSFYFKDWLQDYCATMHRQALEDETVAQNGARFCEAVLLQFPHEESVFLENFRASLGEFHYLAKNTEAGEEVLLQLIKDLPARSVGYAYLADMFGSGRFNPHGDAPVDLPRAIKILQDALAHPVEDAKDYDLEKRLAWFQEALDK
ncbi:MAG: SEC-C domain-containing protein [bacterium]|nr:SEC-C domain-containing protein [bacterium]